MSLLTGVLLVYLGLAGVLYIFQARLIFFPTPDVIIPADLHRWGYEDVTLEVGHHRTAAWFIPAGRTSNGTILFSHGNAGNIGDRGESIRHFHEMDYNVFIYDDGGYGNSTGSPSEQRCYADIRAAWTHLTEERGIDAHDIVLFGRSLGAGPTAQLATEVDARAVILESTFTSIPDMAGEQFPIFPARLLVRHTFDNLSKVGEISAPKLHIHSPDDELIPYKHGQALFQASTQPKTFLNLNGGHNTGYVLTGEPYLSGIETFLSSEIFR